MKRIKRISQKQEKKGMEELGGEVTPASGALPFSKGDGRVKDKFRVEFKFTESDQYVLKLADLVKIRNEAVRKFEQPIFQIEFRGKNKAKYAIVPKIGPTPLIFNFFEVPCMTTYNKSLTLRSGDLLAMIGKSSPLIVIAFDRIPHSKKMEFSIYEWNDFLNKQDT